MGHIYRELKEIPLPEEARINHYDGQVSIYYKDAKNARRRVVIGKATSETTMQPNDNFKFHFPQLWAEYYGDSTAPVSQIHSGLYALLLGIGTQTGLYQDVLDCFGPLYGNAIMDFAAFSIMERSNKACLFSEAMQDQMLFSRTAKSDSWWSQLFCQNITPEMLDHFQQKWLQRCAASGTEKVWLCIDGSNNDCAVQDSDMAEPGHAKSLRQTSIVSYIWAVNAHDGRPVTWIVNNGGMPDCKAIQEVLTLLGRSGIKVEGVILDRGFATQEIFDSIKSWGMEHIVMLKSNCHGFLEMMKLHMESINWEVSKLVNEDGVFGVSDNKKVFFTSSNESCMGLFFNGQRATSRRVNLIHKVYREIRRVRAKLPIRQDALSLNRGMDKFLELTVDDGMVVGVTANTDTWGKIIKEMGYYAISSSSERSAQEIHDLYRLRNTSEKQFATLKSQLGCSTTRSHSDVGILSRFAVAFVASILRTEIELACKELDLETSMMIRKTNRAYCRYMPGNRYDAIMNLPSDLKALLRRFGIHEAHFHKFADELTLQMSSSILSPVRTIPSLEQTKKSPGRPRTRPPKDPDQPKGKPGRPKGSKNKKTLEKERELAEHPELAAPKRKPGRPKGSKNKKTLEKERQQAEQAAQTRKRGRPKGRKNNKTLERERLEAELARKNERRGRPKGRKNNKTLERERREAELVKGSQENAALGKDGNGELLPSGASNKTAPALQTLEERPDMPEAKRQYSQSSTTDPLLDQEKSDSDTYHGASGGKGVLSGQNEQKNSG